jgi:metal-responsive CopG/Arc/MetJ family transcriptional regulator
MKTAISIPDRIFKGAETIARKMGISRSELYTKAIAEYITEIDDRSITETLNSIYPREQSSIDGNIYRLQYNSVKEEKGQW